jgi:hypothetical protein
MSIEELRRTFEVLDKDGNGSLDASELLDFVRGKDMDPPFAVVRAILEDMDTDGNGLIDFDEFVRRCLVDEEPVPELRRAGNVDAEMAALETYWRLDTDGDGSLSAEEIRSGIVRELSFSTEPGHIRALNAVLKAWERYVSKYGKDWRITYPQFRRFYLETDDKEEG